MFYFNHFRRFGFFKGKVRRGALEVELPTGPLVLLPAAIQKFGAALEEETDSPVD